MAVILLTLNIHQQYWISDKRPCCPVRDPETPTWALQTSRHHFLHVGAIEVCFHDAVQRDIGPEDQFLAVVEVQGNGVLQVVEQQGVLGTMRQDLTDVYAIGKQQHWLWA